jgi:hypothetical protein
MLAQIASDSQARSSPASAPSRSTGTLPPGEIAASAACDAASNSGRRVSWNGMPGASSSAHGRSDLDEQFMMPMTRSSMEFLRRDRSR